MCVMCDFLVFIKCYFDFNFFVGMIDFVKISIVFLVDVYFVVDNVWMVVMVFGMVGIVVLMFVVVNYINFVIVCVVFCVWEIVICKVVGVICWVFVL